VSIAELPNNRPRDPNINSVGAEFERTPPQDLIANNLLAPSSSAHLRRI